ncbi:unnamed protein product [Aphanomyces euteiches]|uniref:ACB domain-containing protein n=1 Tax=Aphanomyces euteiches TaxID=100861 RepID=A0A6G0WN88_9STRA|nr:hypothetical protein Ae201684_013398 [Aphanomyces euteiches]KAH9062929.1 hypothetical protein Ae201684P_009195 [Aphanomyces euteiches]KAH9156704.1 hypothetical protein AeRB84_001392 [Aphanomyces euteiches]
MVEGVKSTPALWIGAATVVAAILLHSLFYNRTPKPKNQKDLPLEVATELDRHFVHASSYVAANPQPPIGNEEKLVLYAFYKQATTGDCNTTKPSAIDLVAKAKWDAWNGLNGMPSIEAKKRYLEVVSSMFPNYSYGSELPTPLEDSSSHSGSEGDSGGDFTMTPLMSQVVVDKTGKDWEVVENQFHFAKMGQLTDVQDLLATDTSRINEKDDEGRTMLHWAVDRGQEEMVSSLLSQGADVNATDGDGMTPLHYAVSCEHIPVVDLLLTHGADTNVADNDGETALMSASSALRQHILDFTSKLNQEPTSTSS